jgi:GMP synthase-like glutamine amidotransferase
VAGYRDPIEQAGYAVDRIDVSDPAFGSLDLREPDLLIMMGGPMGVYEHEAHPWIRCQMRRLALRLEADRPTLGVCFGAQMIAAAMGSDVYPGGAREVGFHPVSVHAGDSPLRHVEGVPVLHWHGDTFDLPEGVELLASSHVYRHQAFRRGAICWRCNSTRRWARTPLRRLDRTVAGRCRGSRPQPGNAARGARGARAGRGFRRAPHDRGMAGRARLSAARP